MAVNVSLLEDKTYTPLYYMIINISTITNIDENKVLIRPVTPSEFWLIHIRSLRIISVSTQTVLEEKEDNSGLYYRLLYSCNTSFLNYVENLKIEYMLISCPPSQPEAPECSNEIYVYDMYDEKELMVDHFLTKYCCSLSNKLRTPPHLIFDINKLNDLYESKNELLFWGQSNFPRPLLIRGFTNNKPNYLLKDPYLQWSPPRFWYHQDFMQQIPDNIEGWIKDVLKSFNWDYFKPLLDDKYTADKKDLACVLFDIIYSDYIYYGLCKKLWLKKKSKKDRNLVDLTNEEQVIINFTDIVNSIREMIIGSIAAEDQVIDDEEPEQLLDLTEFSSIFNNILKE